MPYPILFTIPNFITAGSGRVMLNIISRLDRSRFAPAVCVTRKGGSLDDEVEGLGLPFFEAPFTVPPRPYATLPFRAARAAAFFRPYGFGLWHSFHYADDYTEPIIARMAGTRRWIYTKKAMGWGSRAWRLRSYLASQIVADNTDMPEVMFDHVGLRGKVRVIHHGVVPDTFTPDADARLALRERLGIAPETPLVGCVAHLVPVKGHPTLLHALADVPRAHLVLAGRPLDEDYVEQLHRTVQDIGIDRRVHFVGGISDVPAFWAEVDVAVLPTWARWRMEGCPVALLEAMACGKACVATDIPGAKDIIEHDVSGVLVSPEDAGHLAASLERLVDDAELRRRMGRAARGRVLAHFTVAREASAHEQLYADLLG